MIPSKLFVIVATALGMAAAHNGLIEPRDTCVSVAPATVTVTVTKCDSEAPPPPASSTAAAPPPDKTTNPGVPSSSFPASAPGNSAPVLSGPETSAIGPVTGPASNPATTGSVATSTGASSSTPPVSSTQKAPPPLTDIGNGGALPTAFPGVVAAGIAAMVALV